MSVPSVTAVSSRRQGSTAGDDTNRVDPQASGNVEQPGRNGTALLGGSGLQPYDHFIATLLRERSRVKDGVAVDADVEKLHASKSPQTLTTELRQRRLLTDRAEDEQRASRYNSSSLLGMVRKSADDGSFGLKSAEKQFISAASKDVRMSTIDEYVHKRQPQTELEAGWFTTGTTTDVARNTSVKLDSLDCSPRQRQRQRRRKLKAGRRGATTVTKDCDSVTQQTPVQEDYSVTKESITALVSDSISGHCGKAAADRRQDTEDSGRDLAAGCAYRVDTMTTSHDPGYEQFRKITAAVSDDSKPAIQHEETVDLFGFSVDATIIPFIDCNDQTVGLFQPETERTVSIDQESQMKIRSLTMDRWKNAEGKLAYSSLRTRASSLQSGGRVSGAHTPDSLREMPVCRRSTLTQCDEKTFRARRHRLCRSHPSLTRSATDQISELDASVASLDQLSRGVRTLGGSQLLETCKCSILRPVTAVPFVVHSDDMNCELNERRLPSPHVTLRPIRSRNTTADDFTAPQHNLQTSNDVKHPSTDRQQRLAGAYASLPSKDVPQLYPKKSYQHPLTDTICVNRRGIRMFCVFARRRRENARCGGKVSKCLLRVEFTLTRSQIEDHRTTLFFERRSNADESDHVVASEANAVQNLSSYCSSTCSTGDVMLTVTSDDTDNVINDAEQHVDMARNFVDMDGVESLTFSQPSSIKGAFAIPPQNSAYSAADVVDLAADVGVVDASILCEISSGNLDDVSQSLTVYEFAEVMSIFRHFDADLLPTTGRELSVVPYGAARRREGESPSTALVARTSPGVTYSGAVIPYGTRSPVSFPLPLMTWIWSRHDTSGSRQQGTHDDVIHIPYVSACTTLNIEPLIDHFTLVGLSSGIVSVRVRNSSRR